MKDMVHVNLCIFNRWILKKYFENMKKYMENILKYVGNLL